MISRNWGFAFSVLVMVLAMIKDMAAFPFTKGISDFF